MQYKLEAIRLQYELSCLRVLGNVGSEAHSTGTLSRGVLSTRHQAVHILEQLRLAGARVAAQKYVDLRPARWNKLSTWRISAISPEGYHWQSCGERAVT